MVLSQEEGRRQVPEAPGKDGATLACSLDGLVGSVGCEDECGYCIDRSRRLEMKMNRIGEMIEKKISFLFGKMRSVPADLAPLDRSQRDCWDPFC